MDILEEIDRVAAKIAPGRLPSFAGAHVVKALEQIGLQGNVGRLMLSRDLHLGEGETRTLVKHLKNAGLVDVSKSGVSLTANGGQLFSSLRCFLSEQVEVPSTPLTVGPFNVAVRVSGMSEFVNRGVEQRDAAIMAGGRGATTLVFVQNRLTMPGIKEDVLRGNQAVLASLSKLTLKEGDVIIIGSADEKTGAELAVKTAALELLRSRKRARAAK